MKNSLFLTVILISSFICRSQAYEDKVQYDKKKQTAIIIEYRYPPEAVENAIVERFSRMGYKPKEEKGIFNRDRGFMEFKNAYVSDISTDRMDYIIKVERKSRKDDDESVVFMIMYKDDLNALEKMSANSIGQAKLFLNNMIPDIEEANLEIQIKDQEEVVSKAEKKLKQLQIDKDDLEKRLADNEKSQDDTIKDIDAQRKNLEMLKGKRKKD